MRCELDERIGLAMLEAAVVALAHRLGKRIGGFWKSVELFANVAAVIGDAARGLAVMSDPLARGRCLQEFPSIVRKGRCQPGGVFAELEFEAIDHVLAPLKPTGDIVVR